MNQYRITILLSAPTEMRAEDAAAAALAAVKGTEGIQLGRSALEAEKVTWELLAEPAMTAGELAAMRAGDDG